MEKMTESEKHPHNSSGNQPAASASNRGKFTDPEHPRNSPPLTERVKSPNAMGADTGGVDLSKGFKVLGKGKPSTNSPDGPSFGGERRGANKDY